MVTLVTTHFVTNLFCCLKLIIRSVVLGTQIDMCQFDVLVHVVVCSGVSCCAGHIMSDKETLAMNIGRNWLVWRATLVNMISW